MRAARIFGALPPSYRHSILAMDGDTSAAGLISEQVPVEYLSPPRRGALRPLPLVLGARLRALHPDLLLTYNWGSMDAVIGAALRRIRPWIHVEDGFGADEARAQRRRRIWMRRLLLRGARALVVPSRNLQRIATSRWMVPPERAIHIPNGIDCQHFHPAPPGEELRRELGIETGDLVIGTVAHLRAEKDPLRLLEAFAARARTFPRTHLLYVGTGPLEQALRARAGALGLEGRVHLAGHQPDPAEHYRLMDLFALSSRTEQMPISVVEAMASERAVLSTAVGDVGDMVAPPNRPFVIPPGDESAYRRALGDLLASAELRTELGRANRARALARYEEGAMVAAWRSLFE